MEIDKKDEPVRVCDDEGYYRFEKITNPSGEVIVRAAYYHTDGKFDPIKTASVPNAILLEQFKLTVMNDLIDDKHGLSCVMEEILQSVIRKTLGPPRKKRKASRH